MVLIRMKKKIILKIIIIFSLVGLSLILGYVGGYYDADVDCDNCYSHIAWFQQELFKCRPMKVIEWNINNSINWSDVDVS
jgi:hypothetical protein